ncbi:MAG: type II toxin-antitoxin system HicB family antitoxin [Candidatus Thorarchaeota archaeon]|nr:type II toxin-antitoxin system HicB family antitoxin [Candidatus Thorarchaeota archaeon]
MQLPVIVTKERQYFVALAPDVDIASQGLTMDEALANLEEALDFYFEDEDVIRPTV